MRPEQISSWTIAGMPSRVEVTRWRWISLARPAASVAVRLLAPEMRVMCPMPWASTAAARPASSRGPSASWKTPALPSWAIVSSIVMRASRSATRSPVPSVGSR
jgi:hypothetical protein